MDVEAWEAHRELDRMPDPYRNPCERVEAENERLREAIRNAVEHMWENEIGVCYVEAGVRWQLIEAAGLGDARKAR